MSVWSLRLDEPDEIRQRIDPRFEEQPGARMSAVEPGEVAQADDCQLVAGPVDALHRSVDQRAIQEIQLGDRGAGLERVALGDDHLGQLFEQEPARGVDVLARADPDEQTRRRARQLVEPVGIVVQLLGKRVEQRLIRLQHGFRAQDREREAVAEGQIVRPGPGRDGPQPIDRLVPTPQQADIGFLRDQGRGLSFVGVGDDRQFVGERRESLLGQDLG